MTPELKYTGGFKYQLAEKFVIETGLRTSLTVKLPFAKLERNGLLTIEKGFAWDGASGPTIDTESSFVGGLVHDALYRFIQTGLLTANYKDEIDELFHALLVSQGMWKWRARIWYNGVKDFGHRSAITEKKIKTIKVKQ